MGFKICQLCEVPNVQNGLDARRPLVKRSCCVAAVSPAGVNRTAAVAAGSRASARMLKLTDDSLLMMAATQSSSRQNGLR